VVSVLELLIERSFLVPSVKMYVFFLFLFPSKQ